MFKIHDHLFVGLAGLGTDVQTLYNRFKFRHNLYKLREDRDMKPSTFANLVSAMLYEKRCALVAGGGPPRPRARAGVARRRRSSRRRWGRPCAVDAERPLTLRPGRALPPSRIRFGPYFAEPVIAGLDPESNEPFITGMDLLGAMAPSSDFIVREPRRRRGRAAPEAAPCDPRAGAAPD